MVTGEAIEASHSIIAESTSNSDESASIIPESTSNSDESASNTESTSNIAEPTSESTKSALTTSNEENPAADASNMLNHYSFNEEGQLLDQDGHRFVFTAQNAYEKLGEQITQEIYKIMVKPPYSLHCRTFSSCLEEFDSNDGNQIDEILNDPSHPFIFASQNLYSAEKLVVLINGSGAVRAGQWTRKLIINESLEVGSMLPYIQKCNENGWAVVVMNTNDNEYFDSNGHKFSKKLSESPIKHGINVWMSFVEKSAAKMIGIVAHSFGGMVTSKILQNLSMGQIKRIKTICLTDAMFPSLDISGIEYFPEICNWVVSDKPLNEPLDTDDDDDGIDEGENKVFVVSAGTKEHERTSSAAIIPIFDNISKAFTV